MIADKLVCPKCKRIVDLSIYGSKFDLLTQDNRDIAYPITDFITIKPICNFYPDCRTTSMVRCTNEILPLIRKLTYHHAFDISVVPATLSTEYIETITNPRIDFRIGIDRTFAINTLKALNARYPNVKVLIYNHQEGSIADTNTLYVSIRINYKYDYENAIPFEEVNIIGSISDYNREYFQFLKELEVALV